MKNNKAATTVLIIGVMFSSALVSTAANGNTKQKPPVTKSMTASSWYQPIYDFFTFA